MLAVAMSSSASLIAETNLDRAKDLYEHTQYRECLQAINGQNTPDASRSSEPHFVTGQCSFMLGDYKKAADEFEKAVNAAPQNSVYWDWLGRAYGKRAETSSFLTAGSYASKAREYFERAVAADPRNLDAVDDLFEYYLEAPGFLGGGTDKAERLAESIRSVDPARYHALRARLAEKKKQPALAEQEWRAAAAAAPNDPSPLINLARFLARQGRYAESDAAFERAAQLAPENAQLKFYRARAYIESNRNAEQARQLLQEYLKASLTPDDPSREDAEKLLQKIPRG
jgi:Tfp pilus assembly protein PilF